MRKCVTIAQKKNGEWVTLAHPDVSIHEQKAAFKELKAKNGDGYKEAMILFTPGKRCSFAAGVGKTFTPSMIDDLTQLAEDGLKAVIKKEELEVEFSEDHEETRAAIRAAREGKEPEPKEDETTDGDEPKPLEEQTKAELTELIEKEELVVEKGFFTKKETLIEGIIAAREAKKELEEKGADEG